MLKTLVVLGTRPEAIKLAPVIKALQQSSEQIETCVCLTGQHRSMVEQVIELFDIIPDYDLNLMRQNQSLVELTSNVLVNLEPILQAEAPDWLIVQGDTTTVMAAAVAGFYHRIKVGHVEAGLRTYNKYHPFPEEVNRRIVGVMADLHFAPTMQARENLLAENAKEEQIVVTGNTVIDALQWVVNQPQYDNELFDSIPKLSDPARKLILVTAHRRENHGQPMSDICEALHDLAVHFGDSVHVVFPAHLNPNVQKSVRALLSRVDNVSIIPPVDYLDMIHLLQRAWVILTDSGGIQEEAVSLGKPVLVLREVTERNEAVDAGSAKVIGTDRCRIVREVQGLFYDGNAYSQMAEAINPYGDGYAAERIVDSILGNRVEEFSP